MEIFLTRINNEVESLREKLKRAELFIESKLLIINNQEAEIDKFFSAFGSVTLDNFYCTGGVISELYSSDCSLKACGTLHLKKEYSNTKLLAKKITILFREKFLSTGISININSYQIKGLEAKFDIFIK